MEACPWQDAPRMGYAHGEALRYGTRESLHRSASDGAAGGLVGDQAQGPKAAKLATTEWR